MELKRIQGDFSVCRLDPQSSVRPEGEFCFIGKTDEELSLVCLTELVPADAVLRDDGWKCFRIQGILDFSLIGVLAGISAVLADEKIGIFAVSTYNTDYIFVRKADYDRALKALASNGYDIVG